MKLTYDQIINILLLTIIIVLLVNMSSRNFIKKLFNYCAYKINPVLNKDYKISLYSNDDTKSDKDNCDGEGICFNNHENTSQDIESKKSNLEINKSNDFYNKINKISLSDNNKISSINDSKENRKSSASIYYSENLEDKLAEQIYDFFEVLISQPEYTITKVSKKFKSSHKQINNLIKFIEGKINSNSNFKFSDLKILNNVLYFTDKKIVEIQPIILLMNYHFIDISKKSKQSKLEGQIKIQIELYFEFDDTDNVFVSQSKFANKFGAFKISRLSILEFNKKISTDIESIIDNNNRQKNINIVDKNNNNIPLLAKDSKDGNNKNFTYNLSESNDSKENLNFIEKKTDNKLYIDYNTNTQTDNLTFQADNYSETINSLIPDKIVITDNSPNLYINN